MFIICFSILRLFFNFCHKNLHIFALSSSAVLKPAQAGLVTIETIQLKSFKVLKSGKIPTEKFCRYWGWNPGLQLPIMSLMHILLNSIDADMKSEIGSLRGGLRPYPLRCHVQEAFVYCYHLVNAIGFSLCRSDQSSIIKGF